MITLAHRIQLMPNNKQRTYFHKAIGCCRFAYNWGLEEWQRRREAGERGITGRKIRNSFNAVRGEEFPWTYEVTKYATAHAFDDLQMAFDNFFAHRTKYPKKHKKRDGFGSFYIGTDQAKLSDTHKGLRHLKNTAHNVHGKYQYLNVPNLGYVKMSEHLRFNGKVLGVRISQNGDKFFASIQVQITEEEYRRTHRFSSESKRSAVGIDFGLEEAMTLSDGIAIHNPRTIRKHQRKITRLSRQLSKRQHAKTKQERLQGVKRSNNFRKLSIRLGREQRHVTSFRRDFTHKLTTVLVTYYSAICIEDLNVKGMQRGRLAKSVSDMAFGELRRQIEYKAAVNGTEITVADRFYPSSKTCSWCGEKNDNLTLRDRLFVCPKCGKVINRDLNAALNLLSLIPNVGTDYPELTPADLTALQSRFSVNGIATSKVETGKQRKL